VLDIYGKPAQVANYEVYRSSTPDVAPTRANRIGVAAGSEFVDAGVLGPGGPSYYYRVRAVDADGNPGGFGGQLPDGIRALQIGWAPGQVVLQWLAVASDFDGAPTDIAGYEVYGGPAPVGREAIESGAAGPPLSSGPATTVVLPAPSGSGYYSVIVVDERGNRSPF
jgi:hypothetical protein